MENFINNAPFIVVLLCLIVGFVFLVKGADLFVEGSSSVAKRYHWTDNCCDGNLTS